MFSSIIYSSVVVLPILTMVVDGYQLAENSEAASHWTSLFLSVSAQALALIFYLNGFSKPWEVCKCSLTRMEVGHR